MAKRANGKEIPEWVNQNDNNYPQNGVNNANAYANNNSYPNNNYSNNNNNSSQLSNQAPGGGHKERIVPIQFEQSPSKAPTSPGFSSAQPYQNTAPQYNRVQAPAPFSPQGKTN